MTEEEAKTKWCPFARTLVSIDSKPASVGIGGTIGPVALGSANRFQGDHVALCIASGCMAWRSRPQWRVRSDYGWQDGVPHGDNKGPNNETRSAGYCGLAGQP